MDKSETTLNDWLCIFMYGRFILEQMVAMVSLELQEKQKVSNIFSVLEN